MADETHHRDVNHTFADMKSDDPNPFVMQHKDNAMAAWRLSESAVVKENTTATANSGKL